MKENLIKLIQQPLLFKFSGGRGLHLQLTSKREGPGGHQNPSPCAPPLSPLRNPLPHPDVKYSHRGPDNARVHPLAELTDTFYLVVLLGCPDTTHCPESSPLKYHESEKENRLPSSIIQPLVCPLRAIDQQNIIDTDLLSILTKTLCEQSCAWPAEVVTCIYTWDKTAQKHTHT